MHRPRPGSSEAGENGGVGRHEVGVKDPGNLVGGLHRIQQRADQIKQTALPLRRELLPHRPHRFEGRMILGGQHKGHPRAPDALGKTIRRQIDFSAQRREDVGTAAGRGDAAVAMLDDRYPRAG